MPETLPLKKQNAALFIMMSIYNGVKVFESELSKIISNGMERDFEPGNDDGVVLIFDTRYDKSNGLVFVGSSSGAR